MVLHQEEIDLCRAAFLSFDKDRIGTIDIWELRQVLEAMGQNPTEDELFPIVSQVDENMSGAINFGDFLKVVEDQKTIACEGAVTSRPGLPRTTPHQLRHTPRAEPCRWLAASCV